MDAEATEALSTRRMRGLLLLQIVLLLSFGRPVAQRFTDAAAALEGAGSHGWLLALAFPVVFGAIVSLRLAGKYWRVFVLASTPALMVATTARWLPDGAWGDAIFLVLACSWLFLIASGLTLFLRDRAGVA